MKTHPEEHVFQSMKAGVLSQEEEMTFLAHIADCEQCAEHFCSLATPVLTPPPDFEEKIISKWQTQQSSHRLSLFLYSLRVGIAACIALALLYSGVFQYFRVDNFTLKPSNSICITEKIRHFTDKLFHWEVLPHD